MQAPTHFLFSIWLWMLLQRYNFPPWLSLLLVFLSHILLDVLANLTYHPPTAHTDDRFWVAFHVGVYIATAILIVLFISLWYVLLTAIAVDIVDWYILRPIFGRKKNSRLGSGILHKTLIDPIIQASRIPNLREKKPACLIEIVMDIILLLLVYNIIPW